jgi:UDP-glucuronate decarboxylase
MLPNDGRVVSNFICQALLGKDLTIYGDGTQTRSFCYVSDMVRGLIGLMESSEQNPVNLGNPHEVTIEGLARAVLRLIPSASSKITYLQLPKDDPMRRKPDISLAESALQWIPQVALEEGLAATVDYFRGETEHWHGA